MYTKQCNMHLCSDPSGEMCLCYMHLRGTSVIKQFALMLAAGALGNCTYQEIDKTYST